MIVAPYRISLFGGGTDVDPYKSNYGGICINLAIDKYQKIEEAEDLDLFPEADRNFYRAFTKRNIRVETTAKIRSGLGTSAGAAVALVLLEHPEYTRTSLAEEAWQIEVNKLKLFGGVQDHFASAFGGFNIFRFNKDSTQVNNLPKEVGEDLERHLLLFHSGIIRSNPKIQEELKDLTPEKKHTLDVTKQLAEFALPLILKKDWPMVGKLLDIGFYLKRRVNPHMSEWGIDKMYRDALNAGAWGGKLLGSGGGGYMVFLADPRDHQRIQTVLEQKKIPWKIDWEGARKV